MTLQKHDGLKLGTGETIMSTTDSVLLIVLCVLAIIGSFWMLYGTHPRVPR